MDGLTFVLLYCTIKENGNQMEAIMEIKNLQVWQPDGTFSPGSVHIQGDRFVEQSADGVVVDGKQAYAIPGLVDLHFHGAVGHDVSDGTKEGLEAICAYELSQGITTICPATMTLSEESLSKAMNAVKEHRQQGATLAGVHLEGPFCSYAKRGAQNPAYLYAPDKAMFQRLQEASGGAVRVISLAPELEGALEFAQDICDQAVVSIAHTDADYACTKAAFQAGFSHVTHFYNAMTPLTHRAPGVVGAALEVEGDHTVELICDGIHLHPAAVRLVIKVLGKERVLFVSDTMRAVGLADGEYNLGGQAVTVRGNDARLSNGTIAGSATNLMGCVRVAAKEMDIPLGTAVLCASANPAKKLGIYHEVGSIASGKLADLVLLDENLEIQAIYHNGVSN